MGVNRLPENQSKCQKTSVTEKTPPQLLTEGYLSSDSDQRYRIQKRIGQTSDQIGGPWPRCGNADSHLTTALGVALCCKYLPLRCPTRTPEYTHAVTKAHTEEFNRGLLSAARAGSRGYSPAHVGRGCSESRVIASRLGESPWKPLQDIQKQHCSLPFQWPVPVCRTPFEAHCHTGHAIPRHLQQPATTGAGETSPDYKYVLLAKCKSHP